MPYTDPEMSSILVRIPAGLKKRLAEAAKIKNRRDPGGNFTSHSLARVAITQMVERIEAEEAERSKRETSQQK